MNVRPVSVFLPASTCPRIQTFGFNKAEYLYNDVKLMVWSISDYLKIPSLPNKEALFWKIFKS